MFIAKFFQNIKKNKATKISDHDQKLSKSKENPFNNNNTSINQKNIVSKSQHYGGSLLAESNKIILTERSETHGHANSFNSNGSDLITNSPTHNVILPLINNESDHNNFLSDKTNRNNILMEDPHKLEIRQEENIKNRKTYQIPLLLHDISPKMALKKNSPEYLKQSDSSKEIISAYSSLHGRNYVHKASKLRKRDIEIVYEVSKSHNISKNSGYPNQIPKLNSSLLNERNKRIHHPNVSDTYQKVLPIDRLQDENSIGNNRQLDQRVDKFFTRSEAYVRKNKIGLLKTLKNLEEISKQDHDNEANLLKLHDMINFVNTNDEIINNNNNKYPVLLSQNYAYMASNTLNVPSNNKQEIIKNESIIKLSSRKLSDDSPAKKLIVYKLRFKLSK